VRRWPSLFGALVIALEQGRAAAHCRAVTECRTRNEVPTVKHLCEAQPSPLADCC